MPAPTATATYYISTNGSTPGSYDAYETSLDAAITDWSADTWNNTTDHLLFLVAADGGGKDTTAVQALSSSFWGNPPASITIRVVDAEWPDMADIWDTAKYHLGVPINSRVFLQVSDINCDVYIEGIQLHTTNNAAQPLLFNGTPSGKKRVADSVVVKVESGVGLVFYGIRMGGGGTGVAQIVQNCALLGNGLGNGIDGSGFTSTPDMVMQHNFVDGWNNGLSTNAMTTVIWNNNLSINNTTADYDTPVYSPAASSGNFSSDATSPDGSAYQNYDGVTKTITFDSGADNYKLTAGVDDNDDILAGGSDISATGYPLDYDIEGNARVEATPTSGAWEPDSGPALVFKDLQALYRIAELVSRDSQFLNNIKNLVGKNSQYLYSIKNLVNKDAAFPYSLYELINADAELLYAMNNLATKDLEVLFQVFELVSADNQFLYTLFELINADASLLYKIAHLVTADSSLLYEILNNGLVSKDLQFLYQMSGVIGTDFNAPYEIRNLIAKDVEYPYSVAQLASKNTQILYQVFQLAGKDFSAPSRVLQLVNADGLFTYDIRNKVSRDLQNLYSIKNLSNKDLVLLNRLYQLSQADLLLLYKLGLVVAADIEALISINAPFQAKLKISPAFDGRHSVIPPFAGKIEINH